MTKAVHKWTFHIKSDLSVIIGFVTKSTHHNNDFSADRENLNYALISNGYTYFWKNGKQVGYPNQNRDFQKDDTVIITLDLFSRTISYEIVDVEKDFIAHKDVVQDENIQYQLAAILLQPRTQITMTKYESSFIIHNA